MGAFKARNGEERSSTGGETGAVATGLVFGVVAAAGLTCADSDADVVEAEAVDGAGVEALTTGVGAESAIGLMAEPLSIASC